MFALPGYVLLETIRHDGRHLVHRARRSSDDSAVVIKSPAGAASTARTIAGLRHEWEILRGLSGAGVVQALALERHGPGLALVTRDAGPRTLADELARGVPTLDRFLDWAIELAAAVAWLHDRHLSHRDLHPGNIVLDASGTHLTLIDFELATTLTVLETEPVPVAELDESLPYLSPEQTGRTRRSADFRADFYGLGATYYAMLAGQPPFVSDDPLAVIHAHLARRPIPLHQRSPQVPVVLSELVDKLLAKAPEERYQNAGALVADLREARDRWGRDREIPRFPLARHDVPRELRFSDDTYGRDRELAAVAKAFERAAGGERELVLIAGEAGIGKSALVRRLHPTIAAAGGILISGKFDPFERAVPYAGFVEVFRGLVRHLLADARSIGEWRRRLNDELGLSGGVLTALVPELERVIGVQPAAPTLDPAQEIHRFVAVALRFVRAFTRDGAPLVVFLDDLHWIDRASLRLFEQLVSDPGQHHLLVIGAYRDAEVAGDHALGLALAALRQAGVTTETVRLGPLNLDSLVELLGDALGTRAPPLRDLAALIATKTGGNPFFARRLLRGLYADQLLRFDGEWRWDTAAIERAGVSDNLVEFLIASIERLPARCGELVSLAACIGRTVDLGLLASIAATSRSSALDALFPALEEGLLIAHGDAYKLPRAAGPLDAQIEDGLRGVCSFAHDRVREAAMARLAPDARRRAHLAIGRALLSQLADPRFGERLFDVVDQWNLALEAIEDPAERLRVAELDLRAGRKAKASGAYRAALDYLTAAARVLPTDAWDQHRALAFAVGRERAECAYLAGEHILADRLLEDAVPHAPSRADLLDLWDLRVVALAMVGDYAGALVRGREALARVGEALPSHGGVAAATEAERAAIDQVLGGRPIAALVDMPPMRNQSELATMRLFVDLIFPAYVGDPALAGYLAARTAALSAERGHSTHAPYVFAFYGVSYGVATGDWSQAYEFGRLGVALGRRLGNPVELCRALQALGHYECWKVPRRISISTLEEAIRVGRGAGDSRWTAYATASLAEVLLSVGAPLAEAIEAVERGLPVCERQRNRLACDRHLAVRQAARCLLGLTRSAASFDDDGFDEAAFVADAAPVSLGLYEIVRLQCANIFGDLAEARRWADAAGAHLPFLGAYFARADHAFHAALAFAASCDDAGDRDRPSYLARIRSYEAQLATWASDCPQNFAHRRDLIQAELARLDGEPWRPVELYERSIAGALEQGFVHDAALAEERAACFHLGHGAGRIAKMHLESAVELYARWGATAKVEAMRQAHPLLVFDAEAPAVRASPHAAALTGFDAVSLVKATQAISSEMVREALLEKLLRIVLESAGAERCVLLLEEHGALMTCAHATVEGGVSLERAPLSDDWPRSVIHYVARTGDAVVLADARAYGAFVHDACVQTRGVRSVLCVPVRRQSRTVGVIHLENSTAAQVFTAGRIALVQHLTAQLAISLENADLLRKAQEAVHMRDEFLLIASHELRTPLTSIQVQSQRISRLMATPGQDPIELVRRIHSAASVFARQVDGLSRLAEAMLDVSRIETGQFVPTLGDVDLGALIQRVGERLLGALERAGCRLDLDLEPGIIGRWDAGRIEQVLVNLVSNALKFGPGKPIAVAARWVGERAYLEVRDHGPGIPRDKADALFQRFSRVTSTMEYGGLGLGLYISRRIVEAHGGTISLANRSGPGATFVVELPLTNYRDVHPSGGAATAAQGGPHG